MSPTRELKDTTRGSGHRLVALLPYLLLLPAYVLAAKLGLRLALEHPSATPVWPPTGIAIAAIILLGYRVWPLVFVGALFVNYTTTWDVSSSVGIAIGNTLEGVLAAYLVITFANGKNAFDRPLDAARFTLYAALLSTTVAATIGATSLAWTGIESWNSFASIWLTWWIGDATGALVVAPVILVWAARPAIRWSTARAIEGGVIFVFLGVSGLLVFGKAPDEGLAFAQAFLCIPAVVWIAFRFNPRVATTATLVMASIVLFGTLSERGPFAPYGPSYALFVAQVFTGVVAVMSLVLSAATYERTLAHQAVQESEDRFRALADSSPSMIWVADIHAHCTFLNKTWLEFTGRSGAQDLGFGWMERVHPEDTDQLVAACRGAFAARRPYRADFRLKRFDDVYCWVMSTGNPRFLENGTFAGFVGTCVDISERKRHEEELQQVALHDPLTGLPNRTLFLDRLGQVLRAAKRQGSKRSGLLFLDIDRFKLVNDTLGHVVGDRLLVETGQRIQTILRPGETVARLAGDEFAVLLDEVPNLRDAEAVAERIGDLFREPFLLAEEEIFVSASIGVTLVDPRHARPEDVLQDADTAMYRAKTLGRSRHQVFDGDAHKPVVEVLRLEADLRKALECGALDIHYQPIHAMPSGQIVGFEALARWRHPVRGSLMPCDFIPVAEQTGLVCDLDQQVLARACIQMSEWVRRHPKARDLTVSVNVSARLFSQVNVVKAVTQALAMASIEGSHLKLEITESVFMEHREAAACALNELRAMGVGVVLDDFGTGYSSLGLLHQFPIDSLKIDRTFVAGLESDGSSPMVASAIVELAHQLNLGVTAEGVETGQELEAITNLKCDFAQGYYLGRPVCAQEAGALLR